jgi:hypothetical protein
MAWRTHQYRSCSGVGGGEKVYGHPNAGVHARQRHALEHSAHGREHRAIADRHRADLACLRRANLGLETVGLPPNA